MSAASTPVPFATWNPPSAAFPIRYSLSLFREIEFFVGDGYRRIPYGGLEVGAVLYGHGEPSGLTILAYRPIDCQHSLGPSFILSAFDLEQLGQQVAKPLTTDEGEELEVVGWLISNCRSDLVLTEQEGRVYDEYFPGPRQVTLLAKPEKMKPTRYGFLARPPRGKSFEKACRDSFILPLSRKGEATGVSEVPWETSGGPALLHPTPALRSERWSSADDPPEMAPMTPLPEDAEAVTVMPAPDSTASAEAPVVLPMTPAREPDATPTPASTSPAEEMVPVAPEVDLETTVQHVVLPAPMMALAAESAELETPGLAASEPIAPGLARSAPASSIPELEIVPTPDIIPPPESIARPDVPLSASVAAVPLEVPTQRTKNARVSEPGRTGERTPEELFSAIRGEIGPTEEMEDTSEPRPYRRQPRVSKVEIALGLGIVCALGFIAAWTYLRVQASPIPLNAEVRSGQVVVSWPPEFTMNASQSSITTWTNGQPAVQALSVGEQTEGKAIISVDGPDVTVQLHVSRWYEDRSGQIRVVRVIPPPTPAPVPAKPVRRFAPLPRDVISPPPLVGRPAEPAPETPPQ